MSDAPAVSVILPVHNGAAHLRQAVDSVLAQSFTDFELIAIDDGSTDGSLAILESYTDKRLRVVSRENRGLVATLNEGLALARGEFVARMDADDVSLPERFARQVAHLRAHPEIGVLGCWSETIGEGKRWKTRFPRRHERICARMAFSTAISHPSVMMRRAALEAAGLRYDEEGLHAEDYLLWVRASGQMGLANLPEILFHYRMHEGQVSQLHAASQARGADRARREMLAAFGIRPSEEQWRLHARLCNREWGKGDPWFETAAKGWLAHLARQAKEGGHPALARECRRQRRLLYMALHPLKSLPVRVLNRVAPA